MRVKEFMTRDVITVDSQVPILEALELMKQKRIKRLPVTKKGRLVGIVTRSQIRDASPSDATSLSVHELNYLLFKMTVGYVMIKDPITVEPDLPVEEAIWMGMKHGIGALPVVKNNELVGIITESDVSRVIIDALGVGEPDSRRITIDAAGRRFGYLKDLVQVLDDHQTPMLSLLGIPKTEKKDWFLILRVRAQDADGVVTDLKQKGFDVTDVT